jgi:hypothetical protein
MILSIFSSASVFGSLGIIRAFEIRPDVDLEFTIEQTHGATGLRHWPEAPS